MRLALIVVLVTTVLGCAVEATENPAVAPAVDQNQMSGTVLETLDVSSYTYVRFETPGGEVWAAVPHARLEIGAEVVIVNPQAMSNFESKVLGRQFDTIYFGTLEDRQASSPTVKADANAAPIVVKKAEGASSRTIVELYAEKGDLAGKAVTLRGKVVKYNADIMGRNWIHLQDGSGDATAGTNDITVTSSGTTRIGDTILVQGTVAVDKDFGAGYRYAIIVEDASIAPA